MSAWSRSHVRPDNGVAPRLLKDLELGAIIPGDRAFYPSAFIVRVLITPEVYLDSWQLEVKACDGEIFFGMDHFN